MTPKTPLIILLLLSGFAHQSCLDTSAPERSIGGTILTSQGQPIEDAAIVVEDYIAFTNRDGDFLLTGLPEDATGPIHITAANHTAWTLQRTTLSQLRARLRPRQAPIITTQTKNITLELSRETSTPRVIYLAIDAGELIELQLDAGASNYTLPLTLTPGPHTLSIIAPSTEPGQPDLWTPSHQITAEDPEVPLYALLVPIATTRIPIHLNFQDQPPSTLFPTQEQLAITCRGDTTEAPVLIATAPTRQNDQRILHVFPGPARGDCRITLRYTLDTATGPLELVTFASFRAEQDFLQQNPTLDIPPTRAFLPTIDKNTIHWPEIPGATLYDIFLAPKNGDRLEAPIWSASTEATSLPLPSLPPEALQKIDWDPQQTLAVRVVARFAPGLDLEDNFDWSTYYAYLSSPWTDTPSSLTRVWRPQNKPNP